MLGNKSPGSASTFWRNYNRGLKEGERRPPCDGCTACCREPNLLVRLDPDERDNFPEAMQRDDGDWYLPKKEDGSCIHLIDGRCSIYARRPSACRLYDCRIYVMLHSLPINMPLVTEAVCNWSEMRTPTVEDADVLGAVRMSIRDGEPSTDEHDAIRKAMLTWRDYLDDAKRARRA